MTEFEEITLKKIIKSKMIDEFYVNLNVLLGSYHISNAKVSRMIGWDPAGYNQKMSRQSDLRLSTLLNICTAISELISEDDATDMTRYSQFQEFEFSKLFTFSEFQLGDLFLHVSAVVEGTETFLNTPARIKAYRSLKYHVFNKRHAPTFSDREKETYMKFYSLS